MKPVADSYLLPWPTSATVKGPTLSFDGEVLQIEYDFQRDNGTIELTRIAFTEVLAYTYRQAPCCGADDITQSQVLARIPDSKWLDEVSARWNEQVGWQEHQKKLGGIHRFHHFHLYFDDSACIDVIASAFSVGDRGASAQ